MSDLEDRKGITLVALAITIIVILILAGVSIVIVNKVIVEKAVAAASNTAEAYLKEQIDMAWISSKMELYEKKAETNLNQNEYFANCLKSILEEDKNITVDDIIIDFENNSKIDLSYKQETYTVQITKEGVINILYSLNGKVSVGDYIEYPVEYDDIYTGEHYTSKNGWRVIDDGKNSGNVKIISTGSPAKWYYDATEYENNIQAVGELINNFEELDIFCDNAKSVSVKANYFKNESLADSVTTITLNDLNYAYNVLNNTKRASDDTTAFENTNDLLVSDPQVFYWIANPKSNSTQNIYYFMNNKIMSENDLKIGIRPVICLKSNLSGILDSGVWKIIN